MLWIICRKELGSYFVSPIAYLLLTMFGVIFGFFFWNALGIFRDRGHPDANERTVVSDELE